MEGSATEIGGHYGYPDTTPRPCMARAVVALGGNALLGPSEAATIQNQREHARETMGALSPLVEQGYDLVLTHGNGPQVGSLLREQEAAETGPSYPLDVLVAETQAQIGYVVASEFGDVHDGDAAPVLTRVIVSRDDPAFDDPTKPVGPYLDAESAAASDFETREVTTPSGETAYRRVVPSPEPRSIVEESVIRTLAAGGETVVCGGGGGVPVVETDAGREGVEAVVDKDYTSVLVAKQVEAELLLMVTDVPCVYTDFGTPEQESIRTATPGRVRRLLDRDEFAEGSMAPKMTACARFVEAVGGRAIVCDRSNLEQALVGEAGTTVRPGP